ncbi:MAG: GNAT family N-acetyltransferase [Desulfuromonadaceae bacterium]|nr:GNAT family N-acetyltransferase [Desulfuromonadaceae bacterium]MDD5104827.1 GNAT family N-acetyltransferase [Desulfuromonadaceae bacterium]
MNSAIQYSFTQPTADIAEAVFQLKQQVYGVSTSLRQRWDWEFIHHPRSSEIRFYCAFQDGQLVGLTVRQPVTLLVNGASQTVFFASLSMVRPDMRGQGIIQKLYMLAAEESKAIQFSKGTAQGMYTVLKKIGYRDIMPNTFQSCIIDPVKWVLQRFFNRPVEVIKDIVPDDLLSDMLLHGEIPDDVADIICDGVRKDAQYLNWRYRSIPHKRYHLFLRRVGGKPVSFLVVRFSGNCAYLVDIIWDVNAADEPSTSIAIAKKFSRRMGASKITAWGTHRRLRSTLRKQGFYCMKETPHFSFFSPSALVEGISWSDLNFVHGEGDIDYL